MSGGSSKSELTYVTLHHSFLQSIRGRNESSVDVSACRNIPVFRSGKLGYVLSLWYGLNGVWIEPFFWSGGAYFSRRPVATWHGWKNVGNGCYDLTGLPHPSPLAAKKKDPGKRESVITYIIAARSWSKD